MAKNTLIRAISICLLFGALFFVAPALSAQADEAVSYTKHIKPIFNSRCVMCHGSDAPEYGDFKKEKSKYKAQFKGPRMDTYPHLIFFIGWPDTGAVMRRLDDGRNTKDGSPGNMYQYLGDSEQERQKNLDMFKNWVGQWSLKRWRDITKEELEKMKINY